MRSTKAAFSLALLVLASCAPKPEVAPAVVAPHPKEYTCEDQKKAAAEFRALPAGSVLAVFIVDYRAIRRDLRAVLKIPEPAPCP